MTRIFCILLALIFFAGCPKNREPDGSSPSALLKALAGADNFDQALLCYSSGTKNAIRGILSADKNISEGEFEPVLAFLQGAMSWDIVSEKITGEIAELDVVISDHIVDNRIGFRILCRMVKENNNWRLDMEKEIAGMKGSGGEAHYLDNKLKKYQ
ncbi:MAG: hypothetical protein LBT84_02035 [Spirochaetia bacterium]|jgi:hypothetical protein|nr:hypothetical protein [Spirochaetia bacterium]